MKPALLVAVLLAAGLGAACEQKTPANTTPPWLTALIENSSSSGTTLLEGAIYQGRRTFLVMPGDRGSDTGNEHVLYSEDGKVICEFGGIAGHVTVGSCDLEAIKYVRTIVAER